MASPFDDNYAIEYDNGDVSLERVPYIYKPSDLDVIHIVLEDESIYDIANYYFGDSGNWGIIADTNNLYNPLSELKPGMEIIIPNGKH